ncbi:MAG TPA: CaiB/BaiF CoA-transferase family protein [Stellaceae bacterium]|jgi:crotonobetainyl-CoA:carnitine CoA-transferase CaiB-like acyl-CoA transferase|nr:CaiB/BaiF CoA-transferase family protein [Stellaceae bacterium]
MAGLPFTDLLLLDLTRHRAGPVASRFFADWGARVVKVEAPTDTSDSMGGKREGFDYQNLHRNKQSLSLNLKTPEGKAIFGKLASRADIVLESFRPEVKYRLGVDYESLRQINPRIICGSISGFGQAGPYASRPAVDQIVQGMSGLMSVTGLAGQGPVRAGAAIADISAGMVLIQGIQAALYQRERTGEGQWVHTSLIESLVSVLDFQVARWLRTGDVPGQAGNDHPTLMPTGLFPTADGDVNLAAAEDPKFAALCGVLQLPHLLNDPDYRSVEARSAHRQKLCALLSEKTRAIPSVELIERLNQAGVPCGPVYSIDEAMQDKQMETLGMRIPIDHPQLGYFDVLGQPLSLEGSGGRPAARSHAPDLGENTDEILSNVLGYEKAEIAALRTRGVI